MSSSQKNQGGGPKVLRIGIVQNGKIIDERELKRRETISVGTHQKATFQVNTQALPRSFDLFDYDGKKYYIRFNDKMEGRIQLDGNEVKTFPDLEQMGRVKKRGEADAVEINDSSRGKVVIGDVTVLFQFKSPAAAPVRPVLPADIRGSMLQNIDAQFTAIFVFVALVQISIVTYARSLPYVEPTSIEQIDESYQEMIMPDRIPEPPKVELAENTEGQDKTKEKGKEKAKAKKAPKKKTSGKKPGKPGKNTASSAEAKRKKVAGKGLLRVLGTSGKGAKSGALADVFSEGDGNGSGLGDAFSGIGGVDIAEAGGQRGTRGSGDGGGVGIGDISTGGGGGDSVSAGTKREKAVRGNTKLDTPEVDGELSQAQIARVMKRQIKALRACYEGALKRNRKLKGKIVIEFEILESGRTSGISFPTDQLGSSEVKRCIKTRAKYWRFPKPKGGSVFVAYPIVFTPSG